MLPLYKRMFKPGIDDLAFTGLGQAIPTIFPFAECRAKLAGRWLGGDWTLPDQAAMEAEIRRDVAPRVRTSALSLRRSWLSPTILRRAVNALKLVLASGQPG